LFQFIKDTLQKTIIDLENPQIFKTILISSIITLIFGILIFFLFYYFLFTSLFNLTDPNQFEEGSIIQYVLSLKIFTILLGIVQFFTSWILFSLILVPLGSIVSGIFAEKIFFSINDIHKYKWNKKLKQNSFYLSIQYGCVSALKGFLINILILPLYVLLPVANIFIFIAVNAFLVGREYCGNFLVQFLDKERMKRFFMFSESELYIIGLFVSLLYTIPIANFFAPSIGNILISHLILKSKKNRLK